MSCYAAWIRQRARGLSLYRFDLAARLAYGCMAMYGARCLWAALQRQAVAGLTEMPTYAMLAAALEGVFYPSRENALWAYMSDRAREGVLGADLLRPMGFQRQMLLFNASHVLVTALATTLPAYLAGVLLMDLQPPASAAHGAAFAVSLPLGYLVLFGLNFLLGLAGTLLQHVDQIVWAYAGLVALLSGQLLPLRLFPDALRRVLELLPFRCVYDVPLCLYTGALSASMRPLLFQAAWAGALLMLGQAAWRRTRRRLTAQGG